MASVSGDWSFNCSPPLMLTIDCDFLVCSLTSKLINLSLLQSLMISLFGSFNGGFMKYLRMFFVSLSQNRHSLPHENRNLILPRIVLLVATKDFCLFSILYQLVMSKGGLVSQSIFVCSLDQELQKIVSGKSNHI